MHVTMAGSRRGPALLLLAAVPPMLEMGALLGLGFFAAQPLAPQATAVWPYDSYHDLRWLLVYHNSWAMFLLGLVVAVVVRGVLSAGLTALAWPAELDRPSWRWLVLRNLEVAAIAILIISPWAAISVAFSAVALSWYLFASVVPMLVIAPFLQRAGVVQHWWRGLPSARLLGWSLLNFLVLTIASAVIVSVPGWSRILVAGLAGVVNGLLWRRTVRAAVQHEPAHWARVPVAPIAIVLTMVAAVGVPPLVGLAAGTRGAWTPPLVRYPLPDRVPYAVIVLAGFESSWDGQPPVDPRVERFSYAGIDGSGRPLPYRPEATHRSLDSSAALLGQQVEALHQRTGRPIALAGESEGALVIRTYLDKLAPGPVAAVLLYSPLIWPGRAYYPPPWHQGWGVVAGWELRGIAAVTNLVSEIDTGPDEPFIRSVIAEAPFYRNRILCPVPGVRIIAFLPLVGAAEAPPGEYTDVPVVEVPALHGGLLNRDDVYEQSIHFLAGEPVAQPLGGYEVVQRFSAAWQAPPLILDVNPIWAAGREGDPAMTGRICEAR
ncbi:hypothetical protein ACN26Y_21790 [Micromonospora sp. WMMD558]|uniref:hypothetical protein n=1 Tax=unclassified Micromonospora TaxID=2617518 RepID=UPI0012B4D80A|nr:hypothetical protein [Micromonospora sp. WMMC415]QGN48669.1 hypothetical protein GKC29_18800 [Micromonospora sp. WMMC415]